MNKIETKNGLENLRKYRGEILEIVVDIEDDVDMLIYDLLKPRLVFLDFYESILQYLNFHRKIEILKDIINTKNIDCKKFIDSIEEIRKINNRVKHAEMHNSEKGTLLDRKKSQVIEITEQLVEQIKQKRDFIKKEKDRLLDWNRKLLN